MEAQLRCFEEPSWDAPFDEERELERIPGDATISGMFVSPLLAEAKRRGFSLPSARDRYVQYRFYPLREHARLLLETCAARFPDLAKRQALRRLGRGAPRALLASTLGKVLLGSVDETPECLRAMAKAYPLNVKPCSVELIDTEAGRAVIHAEIPYFLDSHHVGAFEGVLRHARVQGGVRFSSRGPHKGNLLVTWDPETVGDRFSSLPPPSL